MPSANPRKIIACSKCGRSIRRNNMSRHMKTHQIPCSICPQTFSSQHNLNVHILSKHSTSSSAIQPFVCKDCGENFKTFYKLREHRRKMHGKPGQSSSSHDNVDLSAYQLSVSDGGVGHSKTFFEGRKNRMDTKKSLQLQNR